MHDEPLDETTATFAADLAAFRSFPAPTPGDELRSLFASSVPAALPVAPVRRTPMSKRFATTIPSKIAAGVLGALLAGTVGAGAMTGTMTLTGNESDDTTVVTEAPVTDPAPDEDEDDDATTGAAVEEEFVVEDEVDGEDEAPKDSDGDLDLSGATVPTSVSHAARIHAFDEACGNHGAYVSEFARTGQEPECATTARAQIAATTDPAAATTEDGATADDEGEAEGKRAEANRPRKGQGGERSAKKGGSSAGKRPARG